MLIRIAHETRYAHEFASAYSIQQLLLTPSDNKGLKVHEWSIDAPGIKGAARFRDGFGNVAHLVNQTVPAQEFAIRAQGLVETTDVSGVVGRFDFDPPVAIFRRQTALTRPDGAIESLAKKAGDGAVATLDFGHALMDLIGEAMSFDADKTESNTSAAEALGLGHGVCQDFAHIFIGAARAAGVPARYTTGYLLLGDGAASDAIHAWAELHVADLGWVGFDPLNRICPTEHHVRLASALDAAGAAPIRGIRRGAGTDELTVAVDVSEAESAQ